MNSTSNTRSQDAVATRDSEDGKLDFDGSFSPLVMARFARYMQEHKGSTNRSCGDWKAGMSRKRYFRSLWRHHMDVALLLYGHVKDATQDDLEEALLGVMFNAQGMLYEVLIGREVQD